MNFPILWGDAHLNKLLTAPMDFVHARIESGEVVFPPEKLWFAALECLNPEDVKVVIVGQDPYHGIGQANGLAFSVNEGVKIPPSLKNIFKEISLDLKIQPFESGDLSRWARQGVLLLNSVLTVEEGRAGSHHAIGWEHVTDALLKKVNDVAPHAVFLLWGKPAQAKADMIDCSRHMVLMAPHPSPLSAHRGFLGCGHFSKANDFLKLHSLAAIDWR